MTRRYEVTLVEEGAWYTYRVDVDDEEAARRQAIVEARTKAAADYGHPPNSFGLYRVRELQGGSHS